MRSCGVAAGKGERGGDGGANGIGLEIEEVKRAANSGWPIPCDVGVEHRGIQALMAEEELDGPQIDAALDQVGGEGVAQRMQPTRRFNSDRRAAAVTARASMAGLTWKRPTLPVFGSREVRLAANRNCQPHSLAARGNFRARANGSGA